MSRIKTRYAPSFTGRMHVGDLRAALCARLIAKYEGGNFLLRIEDTDQKRFVERAVEIIRQTLKDTGLIHDGGPDRDGGCGPYVQNERQASGIYLEHARKLVEKGEVYYCFCAPERLATFKTTVNGEGIMAYDRHYLHLTKREAEASLVAGVSYVTRQNDLTTGATTFRDEIHGGIIVDSSELDDVVPIKSDGYPTRSSANMVDDHLMGVTHVVRGNEYLSSLPKYNRPYAAFGWDVSVCMHCPLVTDEGHYKLSKRSRHSSFEDLLEQSFISQAVVSYITLSGWSPESDRGTFTLEEIIRESDYRHMGKSPTVFDVTRLKWMNGECMEAVGFDTFYEMVEPYPKVTVSRDLDLKKIAPMVKTKIEVFPDVANHVGFFETLPECDTAMHIHKKMKISPETSLKVLKDVLSFLETQGSFTNNVLYGALSKYVGDTGVKIGFVVWSVRIAVSGRQMAPAGATEIIEVLGEEGSLVRIHKGIQMLEAQRSGK